MPPMTWIILGIILVALGNWMIVKGNLLISEQSTKEIVQQTKSSEGNIIHKVDELRKLAHQKAEGGLIVINNNGSIGAVVNNIDKGQPSHSNKKEAKLILSLVEPLFEIKSGYNVSAITDNGLGDLSIVFDQDFPNDDYYVNISGDRTVTYEIVEKRKSYMRIKFEEEGLKTLQIECREN